MNDSVTILDLFSACPLSEDRRGVFSQALVLGADIDPEERRVSVRISAPVYLPSETLRQLRDEIVRAVRRLAEDARDGKLEPQSVTPDVFASYLDTHDIPDPDLLIRTSGEERLSNFLLWQLAYSEFYFTDVLWPDFTKEELAKAIEYYNGRDRRYGGVEKKEDGGNV